MEFKGKHHGQDVMCKPKGIYFIAMIILVLYEKLSLAQSESKRREVGTMEPLTLGNSKSANCPSLVPCLEARI